jgi:hypothetical protein
MKKEIVLAVQGNKVRIESAYDGAKSLKRLQDGNPITYDKALRIACKDAVKGAKYLRSVLGGGVSNRGWVSLDSFAREVIVSMFEYGTINWQLEKTSLLGWIPLDKRKEDEYVTNFFKEYNRAEAARKLKLKRDTIYDSLKVLKVVMRNKLHILKSTRREGVGEYMWGIKEPLRDFHVWLIHTLDQTVRKNPGVKKKDLCERLFTRGLLTFDKYLDLVEKQTQETIL